MHTRSGILFTLLIYLATLAFQAGGASEAEPAYLGYGSTHPSSIPASHTEPSSTCSILLVDNDEDFGSENGGGLPYYTTALDTLGYEYDVWDLVSQGSPLSADLAPYQVVLWFAGYKQVEPFSLGNEIQVADYLDQGGSLFLSALDYYYSTSLSWFMQVYLGIQQFECDEVELDPVGVSGNPVGNGLGPYTLTRPDQWELYWPTGDEQGPFVDYVYANLDDPNAAEPFKFNASGTGNASNYEGGAFRTVYLAWPVEWIADLDDRADILGASLTWLCDRNQADLQVEQSASPTPLYTGTQLTYTITLSNLGPKLAKSVRLTDTLPEQVSFITASAGCVLIDRKVSCNMGDLDPGSMVQVEVVVAAPAFPAMLTNQVQANSLTFDPLPGNNISILETAVTHSPYLFFPWLSQPGG